MVLFLEAVDFGLGAHEVHEAAFGSADDLLGCGLIQQTQFFPLESQVALDVLVEIGLES